MKKTVLPFVILFSQIFINTPLAAQEKISDEIPIADKDNLEDYSLENLLDMETSAKINIGSRGKAIDSSDAKVPVDVVTAEQIDKTGFTELTQVLQRFIPGFNYPRPYLADGSAHVRPFTLRGMSPDQVLVLVNGKRLHASSLLHVNGTVGRGSTGVDLNTIPLRSIARVEVLRDGAAAQYGSDAIAGIINIILKSGGEERRLTSTVGQTYNGDGELYQADVHYGITLPMDGFINMTAELRSHHPTDRADIDTREQYFVGDPKNNQAHRFTDREGDARVKSFLFAFNSEVPLSNTLIFYLNGSMNYRRNESSVFFRRALDNRNVRGLYPNGFLPLFGSNIIDYSATVGSKGETSFGMSWDLSHTVGGNYIHYDVKNSVNASLGMASPTSFDAGGLHSRQHTTNLDLFKKINWGFEKPLEMALGFEWRYETFSIAAGDKASYIHGNVPVLDGPNRGQSTMAGAQGFPGFRKSNELSEDRHNFSTYLDLNTQFFNKLSIGVAGRYEYYSDFGSSLNGKFSLGYRVIDELLLRGSMSTGFRAPSLQQSYFNSTSSISINGHLTSTSTLPVNASISQALGAKALKPEKSQHFTIGFMLEPVAHFSLSADYFYTKIDDRIIFSRNITSGLSPEIKGILGSNNLSAARFFTNAINTETQGYDIRANYDFNLQKRGELKLSALYHYHQTKVLGGVHAPEILGEHGGDIIISHGDHENIESGQPSQNLILMADYKVGGFEGAFKVMKVGGFTFNQEGFESQWLADIDLSYQLDRHFNIGIGVHNLFDSAPKKLRGNGRFLQTSPFGHNGGFYYMRLSAEF
ncbi:MAG: TonB-dependent receptor [Methylococcales bacterium]|nr:TonB-dependent receptor [Methylococcales bacterium]MCK5925565.1 TonB-dependent receptor [Methylococcales bacterium]